MGVPPTGEDREAFWRAPHRGDSFERQVRGVLRHLPHEPRCQLCVRRRSQGRRRRWMRALGKGPAAKNPRICSTCFTFIERHHGGAEIEASFLFADIRGSTSLAERTPPDRFHALLDRFYTTAHGVRRSRTAVASTSSSATRWSRCSFHLCPGPRHPAHAVEAALGLLRATGHARSGRAVGPGRRWGAHRPCLGRRGGGRVAHRADHPRGHGQHHRAPRTRRRARARFWWRARPRMRRASIPGLERHGAGSSRARSRRRQSSASVVRPPRDA